MLQYLALARVSSREQERDGFSLEVQEETLKRYASQNGGEIVKPFRIAETATKPDERRTFRELLAYAKEHAAELAGVLFFKVDRAARNLFDYVELERLEADMASFYTEQQSLDVIDGLFRRVQSGLSVGKARMVIGMCGRTAGAS